jgi:hypothetical protein
MVIPNNPCGETISRKDLSEREESSEAIRRNPLKADKIWSDLYGDIELTQMPKVAKFLVG